MPPLHWRRALFSIGDGEGSVDNKGSSNETNPVHPHLSLLSETTESFFDAMAPVNDQLAHTKLWWLLEFWPIKLWELANSNSTEWGKRLGLNLGRYRAVRESEPKMHWTVKHMVDEGKYKVKARIQKGADWQVVA
jgi:hypothetical protein